MRARTISYLELRGAEALRPPERPAPAGFAVKLVDDPEVNEDMYRRIGGPHDWTDRLVWSDDQWRQWALACETYLVELDGTVAGYYELRDEGGAVLIAIFGLLEEFRGEGLGGLALTAAARRALELAPVVRVSTNTLDAPHALDNYLARGFVVTGTEQRGSS